MTGTIVNAVAAVYPQKSTIKGTPTCSTHSTELYETYLAGQEESGCVFSRDCNDILVYCNLRAVCSCFPLF